MLPSPAMAHRHWDRRRFLAGTGCLAALGALRAQTPSLAHINVIELERVRVLSDAKAALTAAVVPVTAVPAPHGAANNFYSEVEPDIRTAGALGAPALFRAQAVALRQFSGTVATLCAASLITGEPQYAARVAEHLRAQLLAPATRMMPAFDGAGCAPGLALDTLPERSTETPKGTPAGIVDLVPLAEVARGLSFLFGNASMTTEEWDDVQTWFRAANEWLGTARAARVARDTKDHRASAWLLISAAFARFLRDENALEDSRKQFRKPTLRNQIRTDGVFPQEVATPNPYRNTLLNFDLLAGACQLLSSAFDPLWTYELIDAVGMREVAAYLCPVIAHPERWGFPADVAGFRDLPGRRPGLLFAGRAYDRPEYVAAWHDAPAGPVPEMIAASFPIHEPLLWTARAPHGF